MPQANKQTVKNVVHQIFKVLGVKCHEIRLSELEQIYVDSNDRLFNHNWSTVEMAREFEETVVTAIWSDYVHQTFRSNSPDVATLNRLFEIH